MGAKTKVEQVPTMTPQQQALLKAMITGVTGQMSGFELGAPWMGPSWSSYSPQPFNMGGAGSSVPPGSGAMRPGDRREAGPMRQPGQANPMSQALMAPIPQSQAPQGDLRSMLSPFGWNAYGVRDQYTAPLVNPFRRNMGG